MNQKEEEKLVMDYFRKNWPGFPKGRLIPSESPDFILKISPKKTIGIELTQLVSTTEIVSGIQHLIDKKKDKLPLYSNRHVSEVWLIIYADDLISNTSYHLRNKLSLLSPVIGFKRIFIFDLFLQQVIEVT